MPTSSRTSLKKQLKVDKLDVVTDYKKKQIDTDFSGIWRDDEADGAVHRRQAVGSGRQEAEDRRGLRRRPDHRGQERQRRLFGELGVGSTTMIEALQEGRRRSQGGGHRAADRQPRRIGHGQRLDLAGDGAHCKKPLMASMGDVAGSGGYYIAMGAKKIFAEPGTLTGSIGVIGGKLVTRGLYDKLGLNTEVISRGKNSGSLSSTQPFTPDERKAWTELLQETYHQFVSKAAEGRKMTYDKLEELAQGRVYTGRMAKKLGLIDELGTLDDADRRGQEGRRPEGRRRGRAAGPAAAQDRSSSSSSAIRRPRPTWNRCCPKASRFCGRRRCCGRCSRERILLWMPYGVQVK